jgi:hypothetical protein
METGLAGIWGRASGVETLKQRCLLLGEGVVSPYSARLKFSLMITHFSVFSLVLKFRYGVVYCTEFRRLSRGCTTYRARGVSCSTVEWLLSRNVVHHLPPAKHDELDDWKTTCDGHGKPGYMVKV